MSETVGKKRVADFEYLDLCTGFDTVCHNFLITILVTDVLDQWIENWLNCWALRVVITAAKSS